jgi:hypothetical protein
MNDYSEYRQAKQGVKITVMRDKLVIDATDAQILTGEFTWEYLDSLRAESIDRHADSGNETTGLYGLGFDCGPLAAETQNARFEVMEKELGRAALDLIEEVAAPLFATSGGRIECWLRITPKTKRETQ